MTQIEREVAERIKNLNYTMKDQIHGEIKAILNGSDAGIPWIKQEARRLIQADIAELMKSGKVLA